jgi:hypothetical protein
VLESDPSRRQANVNSLSQTNKRESDGGEVGRTKGDPLQRREQRNVDFF